nr:TIM-barrel domain-containing protein [uncultured Oribacterium sp.]
MKRESREIEMDTEKENSYGIGVVYLGKAIKGFSKRENTVDREKTVHFDTFYSAGGRAVLSKTEAEMLWDKSNLYVKVTCYENSPRVLRPKDGNTRELEWMKRKDKVELVLSGKRFGQRDYAVFAADSDGRQDAHTEKGMTYHGGDQAILNDDFQEKNEAEICKIPDSAYQLGLEVREDSWTASFAIPWTLFGGIPDEKDCFRFQIYRKKNQTNELLALTPLDLNSNYENKFDYDPETFLECYFGEKASVEYVKCACIILPSGIMHWQRPAVLQWPSSLSRKKILDLQKTEEETTEENLADRIVTVQCWQDVLILEGLDFFPNARCENAFDKVDPWVQRRLCNEALRKKEIQEACKALDKLTSYFRTLTSWWYADGTLGNADEGNWKSFSSLESVEEGEDRVTLSFLMEGECKKAYLIPQKKAVRFYLEKKGDFEGVPVPFKLEREKDCFRINGSFGEVTIVPGKQWKISIEDKFLLNQENLRLYRTKGRMAFDLRQGMHPEEMLYGFGERFDAVNQSRKILSLWHRDAFEGCGCSIGNQSYKNIPLFHSTAGYSLFINSFYRIRVDCGREYHGLRVSTMGEKTDFTIFTGSPAENMNAYTELTGKPLLPPEWVFGPWAGGGVGRWGDGPTHDVVKEMEGVINRFQNLDIPHSGLYAEGAGWKFGDHCNKEEPYQIADFAHQRGIRVFSWQFSHIGEEEAAAYLPNCPKEELPITRTPFYTGKKKLPSEIDFSHPQAMELLEAEWKDRMDAGFDGTMVDFGEITPDEAVFYDGRKGDEMHNAYATAYTKAYRKLFLKYRGEDHVLFSRSAAAGTQSYACQFGGDQLSGFRGLTYSIHGGLSAGASGLPFWGVDAGGYDGLCDEESYIRWTEFATFCPIMRYHGTQPREPWVYSDYTVRLYKYYAWLRENLLPYSVQTAQLAHRDGMPMMQSLPMAFPGDKKAIAVEDEYMYGGSLLVAPVHEEKEEREIYFPKGKWINFFDFREIVQGGKSNVKKVPIEKIPVYIKEGSFIPLELNGDLNLGESMSAERKKVLLVALPEAESHTSEEDSVKPYFFRKKEGSWEIVMHKMKEFSYLILPGLADLFWKEEEFSKGESRVVQLNGEPLKKLPSVNALRYEAGFFLREDRALVIRLMPEEDNTLTLA